MAKKKESKVLSPLLEKVSVFDQYKIAQDNYNKLYEVYDKLDSIKNQFEGLFDKKINVEIKLFEKIEEDTTIEGVLDIINDLVLNEMYRQQREAKTNYYKSL